MLKRLKYDYKFKSLYEIPIDFYKTENIKNIFLDFDNTIVKDNKEIIKSDKRFLRWYRKVSKNNLNVFIVSNNKNPQRISEFVKHLDIVKLADCKKPSPILINKVINKNNLDIKETIIIGDRLFTDVLCGKNAKIRSVYVEPLGKDRKVSVRFFMRPIEKFIDSLYRKK